MDHVQPEERLEALEALAVCVGIRNKAMARCWNKKGQAACHKCSGHKPCLQSHDEVDDTMCPAERPFLGIRCMVPTCRLIHLVWWDAHIKPMYATFRTFSAVCMRKPDPSVPNVCVWGLDCETKDKTDETRCPFSHDPSMVARLYPCHRDPSGDCRGPSRSLRTYADVWLGYSNGNREFSELAETECKWGIRCTKTTCPLWHCPR